MQETFNKQVSGGRIVGGLGDAMKTEGSEEERPYRSPAVEDNVESLEEANDGDDGSAGTGVTR